MAHTCKDLRDAILWMVFEIQRQSRSMNIPRLGVEIGCSEIEHMPFSLMVGNFEY